LAQSPNGQAFRFAERAAADVYLLPKQFQTSLDGKSPGAQSRGFSFPNIGDTIQARIGRVFPPNPLDLILKTPVFDIPGPSFLRFAFAGPESIPRSAFGV